MSVPFIHACPANVVVEASLQDCAGNPGSSVLQQTSATAALVDTRKPSAIAPPDVVVQCDADVPPPDVADVVASDSCSAVTVTHVGDVDDGMTCPRTISRTYRATDDCDNSVDVVQTIVVDDTMAPQVTAGDADLFRLWPPSHRYRHFEASQFHPVVTDNCDSAPSWAFSACASSQVDNGTGDGNTVDDCVLDPDGSGFRARAERTGGDPAGRRYRIEIAATDACGNVSTSTGIGNIHVRHDGRKQ